MKIWILNHCILYLCVIRPALSGTWTEWTNGTCTTSCQQIRTRSCDTTDCVGSASESIECNADPCVVQGFSLLNSSELYFTPATSSVQTFFTWTDTTAFTSTSGVLIAQSNVTFTTDLNQADKVGSFLISDQDLTTGQYGIYHVQLKLSNDRGTHYEDVALHYQAPISISSVNVPEIALVNTPVEFTVHFSSGSNVETEWLANNKTGSTYKMCLGTVTSCNAFYTYNTTGDYNITLVTNNEVSKEVRTDIMLPIVNVVEGFTTNASKTYITSDENLVLVIKLDSTNRLPMGNLNLSVDFGDGNIGLFPLNDQIDILLAAGFIVNHQYALQGVVTVKANVSSQIDTLPLSDITVNVYDDITALSLIVPELGNSSSNIEFKFVNYTTYNFHFLIDYGDGSTYTNDQSDLNTLFDSSPWTHSYASTGTFTVKMNALNPTFSVTCSTNITIENPISNLLVTPSDNLVFPIPDGIIDFKVEMVENVPQPTTVSCRIFIDTTYDLTLSTAISFGSPFEHGILFATSGPKSIQFTCSNLVSSVTVVSTIELKDVTYQDITITYPSFTTVNMTLNAKQEPEAFSANVLFNVSLFNCFRYARNTILEFNFGDGSPLKTTSDFSISHDYTIRGYHTVGVTIKNLTEIVDTRTLTIQIGAIEFFVDTYVGSVGATDFEFNITVAPSAGSVPIKLWTDDNDNNSYDITASGTPTLTQHKYGAHGKYIPYVIGTFPGFVEIAYLDDPIYVDYNLSQIMISFETGVELPPGDLSVVVSKHPLSDDLPNVICNFSFGDAIDTKPKQKTQDITLDEPLVFNYTYLTLGYQNTNITCYNNFDRNENISIIAVENECFPMTGIFDRQYSNRNNPVRLFTSDDVDLSSRLPIKCADRDTNYEWKMYRSYPNETEVPFDYEPPSKPLGSIRFSKGKVPEGIYRVTLNVSLDETYVFEPTFVQFIRQPPVAFIVGGYQAQYGLNMGGVVLDALRDSYELELGYGGNQNLMFEWTCLRNHSEEGTLSDLSNMYENYLNVFTDCSDLLNTSSYGNGKAMFTFFNATNEGYAITVNVSVDHLFTTFTQLILVVAGMPPVISIGCELNDGQKYAVSSKSAWKTDCLNCYEGEVLYYSWSLYRRNHTAWIIEPDFATFTDTGVNKPDLVIRSYSLEIGMKYKLVSKASGAGRGGHGESAFEFITNTPPYGGDCSATPPEGNASTTSFNIKCSGWLDEGVYSDRNKTRDTKENVPMKYEFFRVEVNTDDNSGGEKIVPFQYGGEMTATEIKLAQGDPMNNYTVKLKVHIYDMFGDFNVSDFQVAAVPPAEFVPSDPNDVGAIDNLFGNFDEEFKKVNKGGNAIAAMRLMDATASLYADIVLPTKSIPDTSTPMKCVNYTDEDDVASSVKENLRQQTQNLIERIEEKIPDEDSGAVMSPSDAAFATKTIRQMVTNKALFTNKVSKQIAKNLKRIMKNIKKLFRKKPFRLTDVSGSKKTIDEVSSTLNTVLNFWKTSGKGDSRKKLTRKDIEEFFYEYYKLHPEEKDRDITDDEDYNTKIDRCLEIKTGLQEKQKAMGEETAQGGRDALESTDDALEAAAATTSPGEGEWKTNRSGLVLSSEKDGKDKFMNKTVERTGFSLNFDNESLVNITDGSSMELQVTIFDESPFLNASEGSRLGQVMNIAVKDDKSNKVHVPLNMKIKNHGKTQFTEYAPFIDPDDPDKMMYFRLQLEEESAAILYLKLDDELMKQIQASDLYTLFAKSGSQPSSTDYDFKTTVKASDFETYGFKVFVEEGILKKGDVIVALKPMEGVGQSFDPTETPVRVKRNAIETTAASPNITDLSTVNISMAVVFTGCRVYDTEAQIWRPNGCKVLSFSTLNDTACRCPPASGAVFSIAFTAPNMIDFNTVWSKFDIKNAAVYGTMIGLIILYFILVVILRRYDKKDTCRSTPMFLCDNQPSEDYFYMVAVHTGLRPGAGTKSNVCLVVSGEHGDSGVRLLSDGERKGFETNTVTFYIMSTSRSFGDLSYVRVWHDNSGEDNDASWYLHKIVVTDLQKDQNFVFHCDKWLALDMDDGMLDRTLAVLSNKDCEFETAFSQQSRSNVTENHLWLSLVIRPQKNSFTRVQRLSCILMLLFLTMITNAMFYKSQDDGEVTPDTVQFGSMRLSLRTVWISLVGCVITVPPLVIVTNLFRNASGKTVTKKSKTDSNKEDNPDDSDVSLSITHTKKFPHWVVYIAWTIVALAVITSAFFLLLYSMQWGKEKAEEWLTSFVLSFIESIFLVDPFKVIFIAVLVAFIMRKPMQEEKMTVNIESIKKSAKAVKPRDDNQFMAFRMQVLSKAGPPSEEVIARERKLQMKMKEAKRAFTLLLLHVFFAAVLFCIGYINRDQRGYTYKNHVDNMLFESSKSQYGFNKISSYDGLFNWTRDTLVPLYYPTSDYNGQGISIQEKFYIGDLANLRLGLVRMRQIRVQKEKCFTRKLVPGRFCSKKYDYDIEEKEPFCQGCSTPLTTDAWKYVKAEDIWGIPIIGVYNTYGGGGYIQTFANNKENTMDILNELMTLKWLDRLTRAVFVEFALYNANINVICYSIFLAEFPETGGAFTFVDTQCFRPSMISNATGLASLLLNIFFLILVTVRIVSVVKGIIREKKKFFMNFWNVLDFLLICLSVAGVVLWTMRFIYTRKALNLYYDNKNTFINFQHIVVWEYAYNVVIGFLVFIATLRVSSALGYNKRITEIAYVLKYGSGEILGFGFQFLIIFFGFVMFAYLMFGLALHEYRNMFVSLGSLLNTLIGRNTLGKMKLAAPGFAEIYFFVYVFFVVFTLLTMFAAILNNTITRVRGMTKKQTTVGITDVIFGTAKDVLGLFGVHMKNKKRTTKGGSSFTARYRTGGVNTTNVVGLMRESLSGVLDDKATAKKETMDAATENYRDNMCTPRQVHMEIDSEGSIPTKKSYMFL